MRPAVLVGKTAGLNTDLPRVPLGGLPSTRTMSLPQQLISNPVVGASTVRMPDRGQIKSRLIQPD